MGMKYMTQLRTKNEGKGERPTLFCCCCLNGSKNPRWCLVLEALWPRVGEVGGLRLGRAGCSNQEDRREFWGQ
jgi:hypothetical protein